MKDIVEIYKECGDFSKAVQLSGLPHLVAHKTSKQWRAENTG